MALHECKNAKIGKSQDSQKLYPAKISHQIIWPPYNSAKFIFAQNLTQALYSTFRQGKKMAAARNGNIILVVNKVQNLAIAKTKISRK